MSRIDIAHKALSLLPRFPSPGSFLLFILTRHLPDLLSRRSHAPTSYGLWATPRP